MNKHEKKVQKIIENAIRMGQYTQPNQQTQTSVDYDDSVEGQICQQEQFYRRERMQLQEQVETLTGEVHKCNKCIKKIKKDNRKLRKDLDDSIKQQKLCFKKLKQHNEKIVDVLLLFVDVATNYRFYSLDDMEKALKKTRQHKKVEVLPNSFESVGWPK